MLAIARALASRPKFLLVDEMSLGLAPIIVERLLPIVRRIAEVHGFDLQTGRSADLGGLAVTLRAA